MPDVAGRARPVQAGLAPNTRGLRLRSSVDLGARHSSLALPPAGTCCLRHGRWSPFQTTRHLVEGVGALLQWSVTGETRTSASPGADLSSADRPTAVHGARRVGVRWMTEILASWSLDSLPVQKKETGPLRRPSLSEALVLNADEQPPCGGARRPRSRW